jgi:hypothetical protein
MIMLLYVPLLAANSNAGGQINILPWEIIAEKFDAKEPFCTAKSKDEKTINFALNPDALTITYPFKSKIPREQTEAELDLSVWQQGQWTDLPPLTVQIEANSIKVDGNAIADGFYNLSIVFDRNDVGKEDNFCAVVSIDWKKDLFAWCLKNKEQIETNPDSQLIHSSIVVSHFDNLMERAGKPELSKKILSFLLKSIKTKVDFEEGNCPDFVTGLNKIRLKRYKGSPVAEFVIRIPEDYDNSIKCPIFLHPDPQRRGDNVNYSSGTGFIDIWWHFPFPMGFEWKDYKFLLGVLDEKLNFDAERIYVNGICGNAISTMALALNHPDEWAECSMELGNSYRHLAGNALNLPLIYTKEGEQHNQAPLEGYYNFAVECFKYYGCKHFKHSKTQNIEQTRGNSTPEIVREHSPQRVLYTTESLGNPKAYWVRIDGREDENFPGTIDASVNGQAIFVKTDNVDAYSLDLTQTPIDVSKPVEVIENNKSIGFAKNKFFSSKSEKYTGADLIKNVRLHGPVWDAFTDAYVVVWGTHSKNKEFCKTSEETAVSLANGGPCFADINMTEELVNEHNLIFVGVKESNVWLSKIYKELPLQINESSLVANGRCWTGRDMGFILIYPNPLNPERYAAVFSATSTVAMSNISDAYSQMKSLNPADVGIFEVVEENKLKWHILEKFNSVWNWHDEWEQVLAETNKKHLKWKWHQWAAQIIKEQLNADIVICEDVFKFEDSSLSGHLTYRDLFNNLNNDWIVKIMLNGKNLKEMPAAPFTNISRMEVVAPVICGVSFVKGEYNNKEATLLLNELENDKNYTVALPYKAVNGERMGVVLKDYKITGEYYQVSLLRDYLCKNKDLDVDAQLDSLKLNIF